MHVTYQNHLKYDDTHDELTAEKVEGKQRTQHVIQFLCKSETPRGTVTKECEYSDRLDSVAAMKMGRQIHGLAAMLSRKELPIPVGQEDRWISESMWHGNEQRNLCPYRESNPDCQTQPMTGLFRFKSTVKVYCLMISLTAILEGNFHVFNIETE
jgi:hypothetical protein